VIVGKVEGEHIVNLQKPWNRVRTEAGLDGVRLHDLRHSFASAAASAGVPLQILGGILGHNSSQTTARYAHLWQDPVKNASELVGRTILDAINGGKAS
jgi:integrase